MVKLFMYISRGNCLRLGVFLALLVAAWVFDSCHQGNSVMTEQTGDAGEETSGLSAHFYGTLQATVSLKAPAGKEYHPRASQERYNRLLVAHLKARMVYLRKAEEQAQPHGLTPARHLVTRKYYLYVNPDDQPPLT